MDLSFVLIPSVAFVIGLVCSQAGISGAFLLLPFQMSVLGFVSPSANATNFLYNVIAIPAGVYRYWREGRMLWILAAVIVSGYIPGIYLGSLTRTIYLLDPKVFKLFVGAVLLYIGGRLLASSFRETESKKVDEMIGIHKIVKGEVRIDKIGFKSITFDFWGEKHSFNVFYVFLTALAIGVVGGAYGVGGGSLMAPLLVTFFRMPIHTIAGASLLGTFASSIIGVLSYTSLGYPPDLGIGFLLGAGGLSGIYAGARLQKYVPEKRIKIVLAVLVLFLSARYILQYWS